MSGEIPQRSATLRFAHGVRQRLAAVAGLVVSITLHGWVAVSALILPQAAPERFLVEYVLALSVAALIEPIIFAARRIAVARLMILVRLGLIAFAVWLLQGRSVVAPILLGLPLILEITQYDHGFARVLMLIITVGGLSATLVTTALTAPHFDSYHVLGTYAIATAVIVAAGLTLDRYREEIVTSRAKVRELEKAVSNLSSANEAFQSYAVDLKTEVADEERNRITAAVHDTVGYALTNVILMMNAAKILIDENPAELGDVLDRVRRQSEQALSEVRTTLHRMHFYRSPERKGLQAIYDLTQAFQGATGITVDVNRGNLPWTVGDRLDTELFRTIKEALTNAFRHGRATEVSVFFWRSEDEIRVTVRDNGSGSKVGQQEDGIGLKGIRERLKEFGGVLKTTNLPIGFELEVLIPYRKGTPDAED